MENLEFKTVNFNSSVLSVLLSRTRGTEHEMDRLRVVPLFRVWRLCLNG